MHNKLADKIKKHLMIIYFDEKRQKQAFELITALYDANEDQRHCKYSQINNKDVFLITYADAFSRVDAFMEHPIATLQRFVERYANFINNIHILPCFPSTSDDGFAVSNYFEVDNCVGDWNDIDQLGTKRRLMLDAVINHCSQTNSIFKKYLNNDSDFCDFFIAYDNQFDYTNVIRPRTLPLFHEYQGDDGAKKVWTTFSQDQVDLNYQNPHVLAYVLSVLIFYAQHNARALRLDAIGFLWKKSGSSCMHCLETHEIIKLFYAVLSELFPNIQLVSETNVPHQENISYFGNADEAQMVYQFPLPVLTAHSFLTGNTEAMMRWMASLDNLNNATKNITFFNFLASHDGIGLRPAQGILSDKEIDALCQQTINNGGLVAYGQNKGKQIPYELNITYFDVLRTKDDVDETMQINRFIAAHALLMFMKGVPALYYNSLFAGESWRAGYETSKIARRLNREKHDYDKIANQLDSPTPCRAKKVLLALEKLTKLRSASECFNPYDASQEPVMLDQRVISFIRSNGGKSKLILISVVKTAISLELAQFGKDQLHLKPFAYEIIDL